MINNKKDKRKWTVFETIALLAAVALLGLILTGCGTQVVYVPQFTLAAPPDALLQDCEIQPPPEKTHYLSLTPKEKEGELTDTLIKNYGFQQTCNITKSEERQWKADQIQIIERKNKELRDKAGAK